VRVPAGAASNVTVYGNILTRWASIGGADTSSSRGKATIRRAMCTCIARRADREVGLDSQKPMKGAATRRILGLISELEAEGLL